VVGALRQAEAIAYVEKSSVVEVGLVLELQLRVWMAGPVLDGRQLPIAPSLF
jgi:hypothetical protein